MVRRPQQQLGHRSAVRPVTVSGIRAYVLTVHGKLDM